jgi:tRNA (guanine37-N1)-methyltransferase
MIPPNHLIPPYLLADSLHHMDMVEAVRRDEAKIIYQNLDGVLIHHRTCGAYMMSARNAEASTHLISLMEKPEIMVVHQEFSKHQAQRKFSFTESMECFHAAYCKDSFPLLIPQTVTIKKMNGASIDLVMKHYTHIDDREYLEERLESGWFYGAFIDERLAGFVGVHGEGSIGMLLVLPEYRRKGIAHALLSFICNRFISQNMVPFAQIITTNTASLALFSKLGFSISQNPIWWLM